VSDGAGFVLDASALLAHLLAEPGGEVVRDTLAEQAAVMSAVNWAEVLSRLASAGADPDEVAQRLASEAALGDVLTIVALTGSDGPAIARLRPTTRHLGLSLADRACLALAQRLELPVLTTDRAWAQLQIGVEIRLASVAGAGARNRRPEVIVAGFTPRRRQRLRRARARASAGARDRAVDRRPGDGEEFLEFDDGVLAGAVQRDEVRFLSRAELGLLTPQAPLALATFMPSRVGA
jgi:PIN domain nuclease of toxin-antitoxin system